MTPVTPSLFIPTWLINLCIRAEEVVGGGGEKPLSKTQKQERPGTNGGQRTNTHQFIFVKKLDERGGNEGVKSLQEGIDLRLDGSRHPQLRHQLDVFSLEHTNLSKHWLKVWVRDD